MYRVLILSIFIFSSCSLWETDAPTDMINEHKSVVKTLTTSCGKGNGISCQNLAFMYEKGQGVKQNNQKAYIFYKKACQNGIHEVCKGVK